MTGFTAEGFGRRGSVWSSLSGWFAGIGSRVDVDLLAAGAALHPEAPPLGLHFETARTVVPGKLS